MDFESENRSKARRGWAKLASLMASLVLILMLGAMAPIASLATPTTDDEVFYTAVQTLVQQGEGATLLVQPNSGTLALTNAIDSIWQPLGVNVENFALQVDFTVPQIPEGMLWSFGVAFLHDDSPPMEFTLGVFEAGMWSLFGNSDGAAYTGDGFILEPGSVVELRVVVVEDRAYIGQGAQLIDAFNLTGAIEPGEISLSAFIADSSNTQWPSIEYVNLAVWELPPDMEGEAAMGDSDTYVSPSYGYSLEVPSAWTITGSGSTETGDWLDLELENGLVTATLLGIAWNETGSCFESIVRYYEQQPDYTNVEGRSFGFSETQSPWDLGGSISATYTDPAGVSTPYVNYVHCMITDDGETVISLEQWVTTSDLPSQMAAMYELRSAFSVAVSSRFPFGSRTPP